MLNKLSRMLFSSVKVLKIKPNVGRNHILLLLGGFTAKCEENELKTSILSCQESLKYACLLNVNATSLLLTTTLCAIDDAAEKYKAALTSLTSKFDECLLLSGWNDELWDSVISLRYEINIIKLELQNLTSAMESVNKVATSVIELSFQLNANTLCTTLCEHNHLVEEKLQRLNKEIKEKEEIYLVAQTEVAKNHKIDS